MADRGGRRARRLNGQRTDDKPKQQYPEHPLGKNNWVGTGRPGPGRKKGQPNKVTADVRDMVLRATDLAGKEVLRKELIKQGMSEEEATKTAAAEGSAVDYLFQQAFENPKAFMALFGKTMPLKMDIDVHNMTKELAELLTMRRDQLARMREINSRPAVVEDKREERYHDVVDLGADNAQQTEE